ncbi:Golgi integral membrane protein 4 isoform X1 [Pseudonaja textilis]|uniref:Golgi integral membrane protein 4 n=1 Tax=Pseudonaja textilis TaxID=8673 RepID=A0A670Z6D6_PSETE|nr:Golgi integral membrane protein 4 isoform X1 [Pseudonaja textilis]
MGNGMCSRKQKRILQSLLLLTVVFGFIYGAMLYYELQNQLRKAEAVALKYQQHQESLSAQLQVVYEHRSRLEKSLQKERLEHKKAKEDFLVYKLEAQETLNKGRQDSNSRYSALNIQHQMLKSQHEELKKQHSDLEDEHRRQGDDFNRAVDDHKQKYVQLQQEKEQALSKLKESMYNLQEENRQLRRSHQDIHTQLQDVKFQHKNLISQHNQLVMTLEEHKSALKAAQSQVEEYRQLKDTLKKMPSFQKPETFESPHGLPVTPVPSPLSDSKTQGTDAAKEQKEIMQNGEQSQGEEEAIKVNPRKGREQTAELFHPDRKVMEGHGPRELNIQEKQEAGEDEEQHAEQDEEEQKKELEEEEMEQAGQPEHLTDDLDQIPEDHEWKDKEQTDEETNTVGEHNHSQEPPTAKIVTKYKSPYEQQLEQQKLAAQREEEASRLRDHQEALHHERLQEQLHRQQQLQERELMLQRQAEQDEEQFKQQLSQQSHYDNVDQDIVQGGEGVVHEEDENYERHNQHPRRVDDDDDQNNANEQQDPELEHQSENEQNEEPKTVMDDINPADDPNNQGEDEFEEAEQEREENLPEENKELKPNNQKQANSEMEDHLVVVGNPDQQEDNVDEQYQEEGEEEAQGDLPEEKKRGLEHNGEDPYGENDENAEEKMSEGVDQEEDIQEGKQQKEGHDENYEEEEEEEEEDGAPAADKSRRRGEM